MPPDEAAGAGYEIPLATHAGFRPATATA
jgi:hypothetical protein